MQTTAPLLLYFFFFRGEGRGIRLRPFSGRPTELYSHSLVLEPQMRLLVGVARMDEAEKEPGGAPLFLN